MGLRDHDAVAFFARHAAHRLVHRAHRDDWGAAGAVFNDAYPYGMPMSEYALRTLVQARRAKPKDGKRILGALARFEVVDAVIEGALGDATGCERAALAAARAVCRRRPRPLARRPAVGSVVLAREGYDPLTIANVRWGSDAVEQRWMHHDRLEALVGRLAAAPPPAPFIVAVAGPAHFCPSRLAFSTGARLAVCRSQRTDSVDTRRLRRLEACFAAAAPESGALFAFRALCRARALAACTVAIDAKLMRLAERWGCDANVLHGPMLAATDLELAVLAGAGR